MNELGRIQPKRIEIRKGALYRNRRGAEFEIVEIDVINKFVFTETEFDRKNSRKEYRLTVFYSFIIDNGYEQVGAVEYKKRFFLKPKRIVTFFQN